MKREAMDNKSDITPQTAPQPASNGSINAIPKKSRRKTRRAGKILIVIIVAFIAGGMGSWAYNGLFQSKYAQDMLNINTVPDGNVVVTQEEQSIANVADNVGKSVVSIVTESTSSLFSRTYVASSAGTGIIVSSDGYILTNKHVVDGASKVSIITADGTMYQDVSIVGSDPLNDIAFLKVRGVDDLPSATLGDSSTIRIGQQVVAIGNALGQYHNSVTTGIISGTGRPIVASSARGGQESLTDLLQTDAAINSGNSGGPLVNLSGQVIGINTAIATSANSIGFSIPINAAKGLLRGVLDTGKVERAFLGVNFVGVSPEIAKEYNLKATKGAYVYSDSANPVSVGGPADKAGIKAGDVITKIDDHIVGGVANLSSVIGLYRPEEVVKITIVRGDQTLELSATLAKYSG
jgi:serine protease Do